MARQAGRGHTLARLIDDGPADAVASQPSATELVTGPPEEVAALRPEQMGPIVVDRGAVESGSPGRRGVVRGVGAVAEEGCAPGL